MPRLKKNAIDEDSEDIVAEKHISIASVLGEMGIKTSFAGFGEAVRIIGIVDDLGRKMDGLLIGEGESVVALTDIPIRDAFSVAIGKTTKANLLFGAEPNLAFKHDIHVSPVGFDDGSGNVALLVVVYGAKLKVGKGFLGILKNAI
jgi:hypothetical protein